MDDETKIPDNGENTLKICSKKLKQEGYITIKTQNIWDNDMFAQSELRSIRAGNSKNDSPSVVLHSKQLLFPLLHLIITILETFPESFNTNRTGYKSSIFWLAITIRIDFWDHKPFLLAAHGTRIGMKVGLGSLKAFEGLELGKWHRSLWIQDFQLRNHVSIAGKLQSDSENEVGVGEEDWHAKGLSQAQSLLIVCGFFFTLIIFSLPVSSCWGSCFCVFFCREGCCSKSYVRWAPKL